MEYSKLVAVTGLPGIFELINSKTDGAIVRSLSDNTTRFAANRIHNFTQLESIEIYTTAENVNLVEVFKAMVAAGGKLPDEKDAAATKKYFEKVFPEMDFERVYASDMKKMVKWFDILDKNKVELKISEVPEEEEEEALEEVVVEEKPKKAAAAKTKKVAKAESETAAPSKKVAEKATKAKTSKTAEKAEDKPAKKTATKKK